MTQKIKFPGSEIRQNILAFCAFVVLLFIFYPDLFLVKAAPLTGDHLNQHFPWAYLLSSHLKRWHLPFWTPAIHCGFPIAAESQIGLFYLPNLILYFLLPFRTAYSYMDIVHFLISAMGTFFYAKKMKLPAAPAFMAAFIFVFGSSSGGAYYNMTSLKTIAWFPAGLYFFEKFYQENKKGYLLALAFSIGMSFVAGYLQVAALAWFIFTLYCALRIFFFPDQPIGLKFYWNKSVGVFFAFAGAFIMMAPQIYLSYQLAVLSNRVALAEEYAYIGSLSPLAVTTLIASSAQAIFHHTNLYCGLFSVFLLLMAFLSKDVREQRVFRLWCVMIAFAWLLALGQWSPLYVGLVKLTRFYSFRVPAKFIIFISFGLSLLAGFGFDKILRSLGTGKTDLRCSKVSKIYYGMTSITLLLGVGAYASLRFGGPWVLKIGEWYTRRFIYGHPGHPHTLDIYMAKLSDWMVSEKFLLTWHRPENLWALSMIAVSLFFAGSLAKKKTVSRRWLCAGVLFLFFDLCGSSRFYVQRDFDRYDHALPRSPVIDYLETQKTKGSLGRLYGFHDASENLPLMPSTNMLYGIEDIGAYSPFVTRRYFETIGQFGNVNDSNYAVTPTLAFVVDHMPLLNALGVSHILSRQAVGHPDWALRIHDKNAKAYLYENAAKRSPAFFVSHVVPLEDWENLKAQLMLPGFDPTKVLLIEGKELDKVAWQAPSPPGTHLEAGVKIECLARDDDREVWNVETNQPGFFVLMNTLYPGWHAEVNGKKETLLKAYGIFQCLFLNRPGRYRVEFYYRPFVS